jgi:two-component system, LytTR family, sensor kinase
MAWLLPDALTTIEPAAHLRSGERPAPASWTGPSARRAAFFVLGWLSFAALFAAQTISTYAGPRPVPTWQLLAINLFEAAYWALASLLLYRVARRLQRSTRLVGAGIAVLAVAAATAGAIVWMTGASWLVWPDGPAGSAWDLILQSAQATFAYGVLLAVMLTVASIAVQLRDDARQRALAQARAEADLVRQRLEMLTLHLQPHFLFNTLNTIVGLVPEQPGQAVDLVHRLSALLRAAIQHSGSVLVPIEQELALVDEYLGIARVRYGEGLRIERAIAADLTHVRVPLMLLQPLLENAIQHTVERRSGPGLVRLVVQALDAQHIELRVEDDGVGLMAQPGPSARAGQGLTITRQRLRVLYGERASLTLSARPGGGACAVMRLPRSAGVSAGY